MPAGIAVVRGTLVVLGLLLGVRTVNAQVKEFVIGLTPTCPYGQCGCWSAAPEALGRMKIGDVNEYPDIYNWTITVRPKVDGLPDVGKMRADFKSMAHEAYDFRGVE